MTFKAGDWIENKRFGIGRIEEDKGSDRYAVRFLEGLIVVKGYFLTPTVAPVETALWNPKPTNGKGGAGRGPSRKYPLVPFERFVAGFLRVYPLGFDDPGFEDRERREKRDTAEFVQRELSEARVSAALQRGDHAAICVAAHEAIHMANLIFKQEKIAIMPKLRDDAHKVTLGNAIADLLYGAGPEEQRFESWVTTISQFDAAKWTIATYFQFFSTNGTKMFMKPMAMQKMEPSAGVSLEYQPLPNWRTYCKLQEMAQAVAAKLREKGLTPRDGLDVQGFIWAATRIEDGEYDKRSP